MFGLKQGSIGAILNERRSTYSTSGCTETATFEYINYHYDHVGNVVATSWMDGLGTLREWYEMEAFGTVHEGSQDGIRLTGKEYDPATRLYYFGARWYDKQLGRWWSKEPLGLDGPNWYHFNFNNPVNSADLNGLYSVSWPSKEGRKAIFDIGPWDAHTAKICADVVSVGQNAWGFTENHAGSHQDAMRHCVWACVMAKNIGKCQAQKIADNHEKYGNPKPRTPEAQLETEMDHYNNRSGIKCRFKNETCLDSCFKRLRNGKLRLIQDGELVPSYMPDYMK